MMGFARFLIAIRPELLQLARWLYDRFKGDVAKATTEIALIQNHGLRLDEARARTDAELQKP